MHPIVATDQLSPNVTRLVVEAPRIARDPAGRASSSSSGSARAPSGSRSTIADADPEAGTITLVIQADRQEHAWTSSRSRAGRRDHATSRGRSAGPTELIERGHAVCVGGGVGHRRRSCRIAQGSHARGVAVTSVIGGRSREWVIFEEELRAAARSSPAPTTAATAGTGSSPRRSRTCSRRAASTRSTPSARCHDARRRELTRPSGVADHGRRSTRSWSTAPGCAAAAASASAGETRYACVDGPEFDAHEVDFGELADRLTTYRDVRAGGDGAPRGRAA